MHPNTAPSGTTEPIQPAAVVDSGPDGSVELSDNRNGNDGDNQPIDDP